MIRAVLLVLVGLLLAPEALLGQWTNRYPRMQGFGHHVYLEGYELPTLSTGVMDPAPAPDGRRLAFTSRGWIWVLDLEERTARRLTRGEHMDFRPAWSPSGDRIALVRDTGSEIYSVVVDAVSGEDLHVIRSEAIGLDPVFAPDGRSLLHSSAREGTLDLWRSDLETGEDARLTTHRGIQLRPQAHPDGEHVVYLSKAGGRDEVRLLHLPTGEERTLMETANASQASPALSPDGRTLALNWPVAEGWELYLVDVADPAFPVFLTEGNGLPLAPAWSPDGRWIYFSEATPSGSIDLFRIASAGGDAERIRVSEWDWGEPTGRLRIRTVLQTSRPGVSHPTTGPPTPARLSVRGVTDQQGMTGQQGAAGQAQATDQREPAGHPLIPDVGQPRFDGQNGEVFFYSDGAVELEVPAGPVHIRAVQGLATPAVDRVAQVEPGETATVEITLEPLWNAERGGWMSGEHHFHLNYGGPFQLVPEDLKLQMAGEAMEVATPLVANLHHRFGERELWEWRSLGSPPLIAFGQEIRSHFLGHLGLIGIHDLFWPWIWGPGYQVHGTDDRPNAEALRFGRSQGGIGSYVHPVVGRDPFGEGNAGMIPIGFIPDAVLGDLDALEVVCLWSDELGTSELWYRVLNLGILLVATAGSDVMTDFYRTMAIGTTRVFVQVGEERNWSGYLDGLREGRSFVTTGPYLDFHLVSEGGEVARPGDAVRAGGSGESAGAAGGVVEWHLDLRSPTAVERVEILVNGEIVHTEEGLVRSGAREYQGRIEVPEGGWVAARAVGGETSWPLMDSYPFAHSGAIWIGTRGSVDRSAADRAARELLAAMDVAEARLRSGYEGVDIPRLEARYAEARDRLQDWIISGDDR